MAELIEIRQGLDAAIANAMAGGIDTVIEYVTEDVANAAAILRNIAREKGHAVAPGGSCIELDNGARVLVTDTPAVDVDAAPEPEPGLLAKITRRKPKAK